MKFRNDPTMTWSSTDADGTPPGGVTVVNGENGESPSASDLCLRFDAENVSLIELSRGTATTASAALLNGGGGGGGGAGDEKRSIGLIEAYSAHVAPSDKTATRAEFLRKDATGRDGSAGRGSRSALANGHAPEYHQHQQRKNSPPTILAIDGDDNRASPAPTTAAADRPSRVPNGVAGGQRLTGSEFAASLSASNGYVGPLSMSQVAPLDPRDSSSSSDSRCHQEPSVPDESTPREEASGCSSSSSDEDGQQQLLRRKQLRQTASGDPSQTLAEEEEEVSSSDREGRASPQVPPAAANDDNNNNNDGDSLVKDVSQVTTDPDAKNDAGDAPKTVDEVLDPVVKKEKKKAARKSVRFRDDDDLVDASEEKARDSDASSTRERPDGASSEESVDAEGPTTTNHEGNADDDNGEKKQSVPRGILKRPAEKGKRKNRVTFNELMTVFADGYPEVQVPAFRPWDLTDILCFAYEPPPGYRDWDSFDPPAEYMDLVEASIGVTTFHGEDDDVSDNPEGKISSDEMMEIYRTEFEYSADAVDEPNDFPVVKVDYAFDTTEILENQEIAPTSEDTEDESEKLETEESTEVPETLVEEQEIVAPKAEEEDMGDESPLDSPVGEDDDDSASVEERSTHYGRSKHGAVTDNEDSGPEGDDLSGDDSKENSIVVNSKEIKPLDLKSNESEPETSESVLTPTTEKELESGDEYHNAASKMMARTNSQIRKSIEMNALRRSLLKGSDVCRRRNPSGGSGPVIRPKSPTTSSLEEKLRWLTSTEDLTSANDLESSERLDYSNGEENQSEASMESPNQGGPPLQGPNRQAYPPPHYIIQPRPTRWNSELLYTSPAPSASSASSSSSSTGSSYDNRPQLPSFRPPPSRPCSFDPTMGALAWEGYLQRDKYGYGGSSLSLMRAPYVCTVERHPNAANYPGHSDGGPNGGRGPRDPNNPTSDELEWFVQRDLERIERIKKRYSLTEEEDPTFGFGRRPSVRGIRPRFGSTSEILQQLQAQMRPPRPFSAANPRPPWPTVMANMGGQPRPQMAPRNNLPADGPRLRQQGPPHHQHHHQQQQQQQQYHQQPPRQQNYYGPPVQQPSQAIHPRTVVVLPRVSEEGGPLPHIVRVRSKHDHAFLIPNGVLFGHHKQNAGTGANKDERGAPEGASSSPKVSSDSLYPQQVPPSRQGCTGPVPNTQQQQQHQQQHPATTTTDSNDKEAVIYYSLRV